MESPIKKAGATAINDSTTPKHQDEISSPARNKSELLEQLKINRQPPQTGTTSSGKLISISLISAAIGAAVSFFMLGSNHSNVATTNPATQSVSAGSVNSETTTQNSAAVNTAISENKLIPTNEAILNASGYITPRRIATVSAEIMGLITEVNVEEGMQVSEGQILARLDDTLAQVNVNYAKAQIVVLQAQRESAQAVLDEAQRQYKRVTTNQFSSDADRSRAVTDLETAKASLTSANANLEVAKIEVVRQQERLANHTIRAPFSGVVTVKAAQPGEIVAPSSAGGGFTRTGICTIVDMDSLEIEVDVNESFIGRVYAGQKVAANLDAYPDWQIPASVIAIIPTADRAKATVKVRIKIETSDPRILPDMGVKVAFLKSEQ